MELDYVPLAVGAAVGLGQGLLGQTQYPTNHHHAFTMYRAAILAAGVYGEFWGHWPPNLSYGLMTSSVALLAERIPLAAKSGSGAFGDVIATSPYRRLRSPQPGRGATVPMDVTPGCGSCGGAATQPFATLGHRSAQASGAVG